MQSDDENAIREKRALLAESRQRAEKRSKFGDRFVQLINSAMAGRLTLDDFQPRDSNFSIDWPKDIRESPGLVAAYVSESEALMVVSCVERKLGALDGALGFHDKNYLGFARVAGFGLSVMVEVAGLTQDSVLFYSRGAEFVMLVDCYGTSDNRYSVVIQGRDVPKSLGECFSKDP